VSIPFGDLLFETGGGVVVKRATLPGEQSVSDRAHCKRPGIGNGVQHVEISFHRVGLVPDRPHGALQIPGPHAELPAPIATRRLTSRTSMRLPCSCVFSGMALHGAGIAPDGEVSDGSRPAAHRLRYWRAIRLQKPASGMPSGVTFGVAGDAAATPLVTTCVAPALWPPWRTGDELRSDDATDVAGDGLRGDGAIAGDGRQRSLRSRSSSLRRSR